MPVILGGDHSITWPAATAVADVHGYGNVGIVHFDAHADTADHIDGNLATHGTPMRRLIESGAVPGDRFVQVGLRGYWPPAETFAWMREQGMVWHTMHEIWERGFKAVMADAVSEALSKADHLYLSVDVDVMDPAHAPGTGTPEPGGMTSVDLLRMVRQLALEHDIVGMDVVEVAPAYDVSDLTVNAAHRIVFEALAGMAERRRRKAAAELTGHAQKSPAAWRTGASSAESCRRSSSDIVSSANPEATRSAVAASTTRPAGVGDLGEHRAAVLGVLAAYDVARRPRAGAMIEVTEVGCTCSRSPILPSGSEPREENASSTSAS